MDTNEISDLLKRVAHHADQMAFKKIYFFYYQKLVELAKSFCNDGVAEELVDDVFVKLWRNRASLLDIKNVPVYLYVSVKNHCLNYINKANGLQQIDINEVSSLLTDLSMLPDKQIMLSDLTSVINSAIEKLPAQCRLVFRLVKEDNLKYRDVAEILGISVKTVEYHLGVALKRIAHAISMSELPVFPPSLKKIFIN